VGSGCQLGRGSGPAAAPQGRRGRNCAATPGRRSETMPTTPTARVIDVAKRGAQGREGEKEERRMGGLDTTATVLRSVRRVRSGRTVGPTGRLLRGASAAVRRGMCSACSSRQKRTKVEPSQAKRSVILMWNFDGRLTGAAGCGLAQRSLAPTPAPAPIPVTPRHSPPLS
jgi:hypothetical protein